jgi:hypothetical protein
LLYDKHLYLARHPIENLFGKLKQFKAIATRYDKTARKLRAAIDLAVAEISLTIKHAIDDTPVISIDPLQLATVNFSVGNKNIDAFYSYKVISGRPTQIKPTGRPQRLIAQD